MSRPDRRTAPTRTALVLFYRNRDGSNHQRRGCHYFLDHGEDVTCMTRRIVAACAPGNRFVADQVGLPEIFLWGCNVPWYDPDDPATYPDGLGPGGYLPRLTDSGYHEFETIEVLSASLIHPAVSFDTRTLSEFVQELETESAHGWVPEDPMDHSYASAVTSNLGSE